MANVKFLKKSKHLFYVYLINDIEVELKWSFEKYSSKWNNCGMENLKKFVNEIEGIMKRSKLDDFSELILNYPREDSKNLVFIIAAEVFRKEFITMVSIACERIYVKGGCLRIGEVVGEIINPNKIVKDTIINQFIMFNKELRGIKICYEILQEYYQQKLTEIRTALIQINRERVIEILNAFPKGEVFSSIFLKFKEEFENYLFVCGTKLIEQEFNITKKQLGEYSLGLKLISSHRYEDIPEFQVFVSRIVDIFKKKFYKNMGSYSYKITEDEYILMKKKLDYLEIVRLKWNGFSGKLKDEIKKYFYSQITFEQNFQSIQNKYTYVKMFGKTVDSMSIGKGFSFLDINQYKVEQILLSLQQLKNAKGENYKVKVIQSCISECRLIFDWLKERYEKEYLVNPFRLITMHNSESFITSASYIPEEVILKLEEKLEELPDYVQLVWLIMMNTGMRIGEVLTLTKDCLIYDEHSNVTCLKFVPQKTLKFRRKKGLEDYHTIPIISLNLVDSIKEQIENTKNLREHNGIKNIFIKESDIGIRFYESGNISYFINNLIKKYEVKDSRGELWHYTHHQCRKTVAVNLFTEGANLDEVGDILDHLHTSTTAKHYHDVQLKKIAELDMEYFELMFNNLDQDIKEAYSNAEFISLKREITLGSRETPQGHGICAKHVSFGPCKKSKCTGCKMLITGPQKLPMWKKLKDEQQRYLEEIMRRFQEEGMEDWHEYREYQAELHLLEYYKKTIKQLEKFMYERLELNGAKYNSIK
ncbi:site-specific integrase [Bacillus cereus group sp. BceL006]|uniref:site-specific integrase n=1 Tax=Bacillus cereus group sp. BceL006 TaxID=3445222 RepID=UPI003F25900D